MVFVVILGIVVVVFGSIVISPKNKNYENFPKKQKSLDSTKEWNQVSTDMIKNQWMWS